MKAYGGRLAREARRGVLPRVRVCDPPPPRGPGGAWRQLGGLAAFCSDGAERARRRARGSRVEMWFNAPPVMRRSRVAAHVLRQARLATFAERERPVDQNPGAARPHARSLARLPGPPRRPLPQQLARTKGSPSEETPSSPTESAGFSGFHTSAPVTCSPARVVDVRAGSGRPGR